MHQIITTKLNWTVVYITHIGRKLDATIPSITYPPEGALCMSVEII